MVVTSTLARTADGAIDALWPKGGKGKPIVQTSGRLALTWLGYLVGAVVGVMLLKTFAWPLLAAVLLLLVLVPLLPATWEG